MDKEKIENLKNDMRQQIKEINKLIKSGYTSDDLIDMKKHIQEDLRKFDGVMKLSEMAGMVNSIGKK